MKVFKLSYYNENKSYLRPKIQLLHQRPLKSYSITFLDILFCIYTCCNSYLNLHRFWNFFKYTVVCRILPLYISSSTHKIPENFLVFCDCSNNIICLIDVISNDKQTPLLQTSLFLYNLPSAVLWGSFIPVLRT